MSGLAMNRTLPGIARSSRYDETRMAIIAASTTMAPNARRRRGILLNSIASKIIGATLRLPSVAPPGS
jgi:hypothetical protein